MSEQWIAQNITGKSYSLNIVGAPPFLKGSSFDILTVASPSDICQNTRFKQLILNNYLIVLQQKNGVTYWTVNSSNLNNPNSLPCQIIPQNPPGLDGKVDKVPTATEKNIAVFNSNGDIEDSGKSIKDILNISGYAGGSGYSGYSGYSGINGIIGINGLSGYSGYSGVNGVIGVDGASGYSGYSGSGYSGYSGLGLSGYSGYSGVSIPSGGVAGQILAKNSSVNYDASWVNPAGFSGYSGYSGNIGASGYSGYSGSGISGYSGYSGSGYSGYSGAGASGYSGYSGNSTSGYSGYSGNIGSSGYSGYSGSGISGYSGYSGTGTSGYSGYSGNSTSGYSGYSGISGNSGYSGYSGISGYSGYSGTSGYSGYSGISGYSGYSGISGASGYSGYSGISGTSGYSGYSGISGASGYSGYSGISGTSGYSGYSGVSGYSGYSGISGTSGYSGYSGNSGYSGYSGSGISGYSGYSGSGTSGYSGYSGNSTSGYSGYSGSLGNSGYSGYSGAGSIYLGNPTSGNYLTGLFPWVAGTTLISDAEQQVNIVLAALAPAQAPTFNQYSIAQTGAAGSLSYGSTNIISGVTNVAGIGSTSPVSTAVNVDGSFVVSGFRRGIFYTSLASVSGQLNSTTAAGSGSPSPAYAQYAFQVASSGNQGTLNLYVNNDSTPLYSTSDLSGLGAGTYTNANGSGFTISATTSELFPNGTTFSTFTYRTGTWIVKYADLQEGWNWIRVTQITSGGNLPSVNQYCDFIIDKNTTASTATSESLSSFTPTGSKYLSGVNYYTGGSATYSVTWNNLYKNTWYNSSDAITYTVSSALAAISNSSLPNSGGNQNATYTPSKTASITSSGQRLINAAITVSSTAKRTVQGSVTSSGQSVNNILLDNVTAAPTTTFDDFDDEYYRLPSNSSFDNYTTAVVNSWTSSNTIANSGSTGYNDGLQVINSTIIYPSTNYSTITNGPSSNVNYSTGVTGTRTYYRFFDMSTTAHSNFTLTVNGTATPRAYSYSMTTGSNDIKIAFKLPNSAGKGTGWLDVTADYSTGFWSDGNGCLNSGSFAMNTAETITVGTLSTGDSSINGKVFLRFTVPQGWTGSLSSVTLVGA